MVSKSCIMTLFMTLQVVDCNMLRSVLFWKILLKTKRKLINLGLTQPVQKRTAEAPISGCIERVNYCIRA